MEEAANTSKEKRLALIFLLLSTLVGIGSLLTYLCLALNFLLAIAFLASARDDPYSFRFAKANMAITLALIAFTIIFIVVAFSFAIGIASLDASVLSSGLAAPLVAIAGVCITFLVYGLGILSYAFLAYKAYRNEECPLF